MEKLVVLLGAGAAAARAERAKAETTVLELTILTIGKIQMRLNDCDDDEKKKPIDRVTLT
jgi:hypothetical protein